MLDFFYQIDVGLFYFINHSLSNPLFDKFFVFITEVKNWYIAYIILFFILIFKGNRLGKLSAAGVVLLIIASDRSSSFFLKNLFERVRPCNALPDVNILVNCTGSFSFPSSHAVNNFAVAMFFGILFPNYRKLLLIIAGVIAFSRPYVGVHYPSDIIGGGLYGALIGFLFALIIRKIDGMIEKKTG